MLPMPDRSLFADALRLHQQGHIEEAEQAYLQILAGEPTHPGGLHLLGVIRQQQGRHEEALELIGRAIGRKRCQRPNLTRLGKSGKEYRHGVAAALKLIISN